MTLKREREITLRASVGLLEERFCPPLLVTRSSLKGKLTANSGILFVGDVRSRVCCSALLMGAAAWIRLC
jgi:hypothetical protein